MKKEPASLHLCVILLFNLQDIEAHADQQYVAFELFILKLLRQFHV